jgi:hypothetical protein
MIIELKEEDADAEYFNPDGSTNIYDEVAVQCEREKE